MNKPISVEVDLERRLGYVYYAEDPKVSETIDVWREGRVAADLDDAGNVVGIEVLGLDHETLERARLFAAERDLAFPNLAANLEVA